MKNLFPALPRGKKILTLQEFFLHSGAGCLHPDNREVRANRTLCPQLLNGLLCGFMDSSVQMAVMA
jgi:hypothetical protein